MYVGITGTNGAGKGEIVRILKRHGFTHYGFGDHLRDLCNERGLEPTVLNSAMIGDELRSKHGSGYIAEMLVHRVEKQAPKHAVFESIRSQGELDVLKRLPGFILLSVDAPREIRWERYQLRGRRDGLSTFEEFSAYDERVLKGASHEQNIAYLMNQADIQLINASDLEELESQVRESLNI